MRKRVEIVGTKIGSLEVLEEISVPYKNKSREIKILKLKCKCDCGNITYVFKTNLLHGKTKKCGKCGHRSKLLGKKIGKLLVVKRDLPKSSDRFNCICDCGDQCSVSRGYLGTENNEQSCKKCRKTRLQIRHAVSQKKPSDYVREKKGKKTTHIKIIGFSHREVRAGRKRLFFNCQCECGKLLKLRSDCLYKTLSCGCKKTYNPLKGEEQGRALLKNAEAKAIRELINSGLYTNSEIGKMFNVSEHIISNVKTKRSYNLD